MVGHRGRDRRIPARGRGGAGPPGPGRDDAGAVVERTFRAESGRALATLTRLLGDLGAAEDAVQEAFVEALRTWPAGGVPDRPGAWITTTARNRALDRARRESRRPAKEAAAGMAAGGEDAGPAGLERTTGGHAGAEGHARGGPGGAGRGGRPGDDDAPGGGRGEVVPVADDQLRLMFTCCHPAIPPAAQVALTLRLVCGLQTAEIARAFLQPEPTVYQRLSRAKAKIRTANIPFRVPPVRRLPERLPPVLACVYLVFSEGYVASAGDDLIRRELCDEGIRLARLLVELMPDQPEARGLLALVLLQDSRRATRTDPDGGLVLLEDQDRSRWDRRRIAEGVAELRRSLRVGRPGPYRLQAAIAACHAVAPTWEATDWHRISALYAELARRAPSPVVELNRAVAVAFAEGPAAGLAVVDAVAGDRRLARTHVLPATRADLLRRLGRRDEAAATYRLALARVGNEAERAYLARRLAEVGGHER
jgi:RNA polymerase sigma-70 factor (ECF subfamily)